MDNGLLSRKWEQLILSLYKKRKRGELQLCICEGLRACTEVYNERRDLIELAIADSDFDVSMFEDLHIHSVPENKFKKLTATVQTQGILFVVKIPEQVKQAKQDYYLMLDKITDPGNFGTIIRTACAAGHKEIFYSKGSVDPFSEKVIRSALGAQFRITFTQYEDLEDGIDRLKYRGIKNFYRTEPSEGEIFYKVDNLYKDSAIIFGNEAHGLDDIKGTDAINIPMPGDFESLNLAQAATIVMFENIRRNS